MQVPILCLPHTILCCLQHIHCSVWSLLDCNGGYRAVVDVVRMQRPNSDLPVGGSGGKLQHIPSCVLRHVQSVLSDDPVHLVRGRRVPGQVDVGGV